MPKEEQRPRRMLGAQFIRFTNEGDSFTGGLVAKRTQTLNGKDCGLYDFIADGNRCRMNGTDQIDDAMVDAELGDTIKITFIGAVRTLAGFDVRQFDIELVSRLEPKQEE